MNSCLYLKSLLRATEQGFLFYSLILKARGKEALYCQPEGLGLTANQDFDMFSKTVAQGKISGETPWQLALLLALQGAFPCNR